MSWGVGYPLSVFNGFVIGIVLLFSLRRIIGNARLGYIRIISNRQGQQDALNPKQWQ